MVHKIEAGEKKQEDEITLGSIAGFYKDVFNVVKSKKPAEEKKEENAFDPDGGHLS